MLSSKYGIEIEFMILLVLIHNFLFFRSVYYIFIFLLYTVYKRNDELQR